MPRPPKPNKAAAGIARDFGGDQIVGLSQTRLLKVRRLMQRALREGWTDARLARELAPVVGVDPRRQIGLQNLLQGLQAKGAAPWLVRRKMDAAKRGAQLRRARIIVRQERTFAEREAQRRQWQRQQAQGELEAGAVRVSRRTGTHPCPTCDAQNGVRRSVAGVMGGPPYHPNCGCVEEVIDQTILKREDVPMSDVSKAMNTISPGGRPADDSSLNSSPKKNWVENAGGLPRYIRMVAHAMMRKGHPKSQAIRLAVGIVRNWATHENVSPKVKAAAAKAIAEWEMKKKKGKVSKASETTWNLADYLAICEQLDKDGV